MTNLRLYSLKNLLEDFYISELSSILEVDFDNINYIDNKEILIDGKNLDELINSKMKKTIFSGAENRVLDYLKTFNCSINFDVQDFLNNKEKALRMQKESTSRTYLLIDDSDDNQNIAGYFALSIKPFLLGENEKFPARIRNMLKPRNIRNSDGSNSGMKLCYVFLIGQIGRNDSYSSDTINLSQFLDYAFGIINEVRTLLGGRAVFVEVDNNETLIKLYESCGFEFVRKESDLSQLMHYVQTY